MGVLLSIILLVSCSDDYSTLPTLKDTLENDEVRIVFVPTAENPSIELETIYEGESYILTNWGENDRLYSTSHGTINHTYTEFDKEYTIVLKPAQKNSFLKSMSIDDPQVASRIKSIRFGKSEKFDDFELNSNHTLLERLDLSQNSQFFDEIRRIYVHTTNFILDDFRDFKRLEIYVTTPQYTLTLDNYNAKYIRIEYADNPKEYILNIRNSNIDLFRIFGISFCEIDKLDLSNSTIDNFEIQRIVINSTLDLSKMKSNRRFWFYNFDAENLLLSSTHQEIIIEQTMGYLMKPESALKEIDATSCENLSTLAVFNSKSLSLLKYNKTDQLSFINIKGNKYIDDYLNKKALSSERTFFNI